MKEIKVQGGYEKGGYEFNVLDTPSTETYTVYSISEFTIGNDKYYHGYIKGKEIREKKLPIDANPRKPGPTKVVKLMQATIQKEPKMFHHLNNGMTIIATSLEHDPTKDEIKIEFGSIVGIHGDGICNGGHTYFSIEQFKGEIDDDMLVKVEILILDNELEAQDRSAKIKVISEARNAHNELESITTAHYSGYYDNFIKQLGDKKIFFKWFEGDPDAIKGAEKVDSLIAKLTAMSPHWYSHYLNTTGNTGNHMSSARNTGSTHKKWETFKLNDEDERNLDYMLPLLDDILRIRDEISHSLMHDDFSKVSTRWRATRIWKYLDQKDPIELSHKPNLGMPYKGFDLSHTFVTMILGAFRENVWFSVGDEGVNFVGWLVDPIELWKLHKENFMRDLNNIASTINAPSFGNAFLQNPAIYNYQLTEKHFGYNIKDQIDKPEVIYDTTSRDKYLRDNDGNRWLKCEIIDPELPSFAELSEDEDASLQAYKLVD